MKSFTLTLTATLAALLPLATAHTRFTTLFIDDQSQGDGTCVRMDMDGSTTTTFVKSISSPDMACGVGGNIAVPLTCPAAPGSKISLLHRGYADGSQPTVIDPSHKGSVAVYMKRMADPGATDPFATEAAGDGWFKIMYDSFSDGKWGTEKLIADAGMLSTSIPADLAGGYYLIRSEVLAMQNVVDGTPPKINPQFYVGCAQVYVNGAAGGAQAETVAIPGYVDDSTPAMGYNIYKEFPPAQPFVEFGPALYGGGSTSASSASKNVDADAKVAATVNTAALPALSATANANQKSTASTSSSDASFVGSCPANTVLTVGNTCLTEIESWTADTPGYLTKCWAASQSCWDQLDVCWENRPPAVNPTDMGSGCNLWNDKCLAIVEWCKAGNLEGPPVMDMSVKTKTKTRREVRRGHGRRRTVLRRGNMKSSVEA